MDWKREICCWYGGYSRGWKERTNCGIEAREGRSRVVICQGAGRKSDTLKSAFKYSNSRRKVIVSNQRFGLTELNRKKRQPISNNVQSQRKKIIFSSARLTVKFIVFRSYSKRKEKPLTEIFSLLEFFARVELW